MSPWMALGRNGTGICLALHGNDESAQLPAHVQGSDRKRTHGCTAEWYLETLGYNLKVGCLNTRPCFLKPLSK